MLDAGPFAMPASSGFPSPAEMFRKTKRPYLPATHGAIEKMLSRYFLEYEPEKNPPVNLRPGITREEYSRAKEDLKGAQSSFESERAAILPQIKELERKSSVLDRWGVAIFVAGMGAFIAALSAGYDNIARMLPALSEPARQGVAAVAGFFCPLLTAIGGLGVFITKSMSHRVRAGLMKDEIRFMRGFLEDTRKHLDAISAGFR